MTEPHPKFPRSDEVLFYRNFFRDKQRSAEGTPGVALLYNHIIVLFLPWSYAVCHKMTNEKRVEK